MKFLIYRGAEHNLNKVFYPKKGFQEKNYLRSLHFTLLLLYEKINVTEKLIDLLFHSKSKINESITRILILWNIHYKMYYVILIGTKLLFWKRQKIVNLMSLCGKNLRTFIERIDQQLFLYLNIFICILYE